MWPKKVDWNDDMDINHIDVDIFEWSASEIQGIEKNNVNQSIYFNGFRLCKF